MYDASGSIGKRYARADEIGVPLCITVDKGGVAPSFRLICARFFFSVFYLAHIFCASYFVRTFFTYGGFSGAHFPYPIVVSRTCFLEHVFLPAHNFLRTFVLVGTFFLAHILFSWASFFSRSYASLRGARDREFDCGRPQGT